MAKSLTLAFVGAAGLVAAGAGGFLALRLSPADRPSAAPAAQASAATPNHDQATAAKTPDAPRPVPATPRPPAASTNSAESRSAEPRRMPSADQPVNSGSTRPATNFPEADASAAAAPPPATSVPVVPPVDVAATTLPPTAANAPVTPPPQPRFDELTIAADSVIGVRLESAVSSATARVEDKVTARVTRDVTVDGRTAIPSGARLEGNVMLVERGGKFKERARLGVRFTTLLLADGATRVPIQTDAIFRDGESPTGEATSKIGAGAVMGAILGAVVGGKKGAAIGGTAGAAGGAAAVAAGGRNEAVLAAGAPVTVRLTAPVTVLVERQSSS